MSENLINVLNRLVKDSDEVIIKKARITANEIEIGPTEPKKGKKK